MSSGATTGTDREVEPAVGELFVVMFEEQFASREHDSTVPCPPLLPLTRKRGLRKAFRNTRFLK